MKGKPIWDIQQTAPDAKNGTKRFLTIEKKKKNWKIENSDISNGNEE